MDGDATIPPRSILLLGGTGFLGTNLAIALRSAGMFVHVAGRAPQARDGTPSIDLSLSDPDRILSFARAHGTDTVVHLACGLLPSSSEADFLSEWQSVGAPSTRLAHLLADAGIGLAFVSSGGTVYGAVDEPRVAEEMPCQPISWYGQAKLEMELRFQFLARIAGLRLLVLRPSNPYGPYQPLRGAQGLVSVVLGRIADDRPLDIWGDGSAVRDYVHVADATTAISQLIARRKTGIFNIGSGIGHSLIEVVALAEQATGRRVRLRFHPSRAADVPRLVLDNRKLKTENILHARPLAQGIRDYAVELGIGHGR